MKNNSTLALLTFSLFVVFGCRKDTDRSVGITPGTLIRIAMPEEMKRYIAFKPGSYWIYQDSATGKTDSVYVEHYFFKRDTGWEVSNRYQIDYDACELRTVSSYDGYSYYYDISTKESSTSPYRHHMLRDKTKFGDYVGWTTCFEYPIVPGNVLYGGLFDVMTTTNYYDSLIINGKPYYKVSRVNNSENVTEYDCHTAFYFADGVGLVKKMNLDSNSSWSLIKYNIIK